MYGESGSRIPRIFQLGTRYTEVLVSP